MTAAPSVQPLDREERQLTAQLAEIRTRLVEELGAQGHGSDAINEAFESASAGFADARVRSFVPILVERAVRSRLSPGRPIMVDLPD